MGFNHYCKLEAVVSEHLWSVRLHHKLCKAPFDLKDVLFGSLLPRGVGLSLSKLAVSFVELPSNVTGELFFRVINNHHRWHTVMTKSKERASCASPFDSIE